MRKNNRHPASPKSNEHKWLYRNHLLPSEIFHCGPYVERKKESEHINKKIEQSEKGKGWVCCICGPAGVGKTKFAVETARRLSPFFKKSAITAFIDISNHNPKSFAVHLASLFGEEVSEPTNVSTAQGLVTRILNKRNSILILDNALNWGDFQYMIPLESRSTIWVTTRNREIHHRLYLKISKKLNVFNVNLKEFNKVEALTFFKLLLNEKFCNSEKKKYKKIAETLGFIPLALEKAILLMLFGPHYSAAELLDLIKKDKFAVLKEGADIDENGGATIESAFNLSSPQINEGGIEALEYLSVCGPDWVPQDLLQQLSRKKTIQQNLNELYSLSWCERKENGGKRFYRLNSLLRDFIRRKFHCRFQNDFALLLHEVYCDRSISFNVMEQLFPHLEEAFRIMKKKGDRLLINWVDPLYHYCLHRGSKKFYLHFLGSVEQLFYKDKEVLATAYRYHSLMLRERGELKEALAIREKVSLILNETNDQLAFARNLENRADILSELGEHEAALKSIKDVETIYREKGDSAGLARNLLLNAMILVRIGKYKEALKVQAKGEKLFGELGDRLGLSRSYGCRAAIYKLKGQVEDAINLFEKQLTISKELGDFSGQSACCGNIALIHKTRGRLNEALHFHKLEEEICLEWGDLTGLSTCLGDYAMIFHEMGNFAEAIRLLKKARKIAMSINNQRQLSNIYINLAIVNRDIGEPEKSLELITKAETINKEIEDLPLKARCVGTKASLLGDRGNWEDAMALHKDEEQIYKTIGDITGAAYSLVNQAAILDETKQNFEVVQRLLKKAEQIFEEINDIAGLARVYNNLALSYADEGRVDEAMVLHLKANGYYEQYGDPIGQAVSWWNQGVIHNKREEFAEQIDLWRKAVGVYKSHGIDARSHEAYLHDLLESIPKSKLLKNRKKKR